LEAKRDLKSRAGSSPPSFFESLAYMEGDLQAALGFSQA